MSDAAGTRGAAVAAGVSLIVMALISPVGLLVALPAGHTEVAALVAMTVAVLDIVVGVAAGVVLAPAGALLARTAAATRIAYGALLAMATTELVDPADADRFTRAWDAALFVFAVHLLVVAAALGRMTGVHWIVPAAVALAGVGYLVDATATLADVDLPVSAGALLFWGELVLIWWLLARAGRPSGGADRG
ncbi:MAG: hypothetical protein QM621_08535 [Aeromicrobium sp.]|uniref:hypothetical protein n=1 Tax=Aeromicrobium sp. TaxID=1871063 RepID=UPI0039E5BA36